MLKKVFATIAAVFILNGLFSEEPEKETVSIRFYDKSVYYPGGSSSEPIFVKIAITNNGSETMYFKLADDRSFSVDFSLVNTKNRYVKHGEDWEKKRNSNRQIYFREISLEPGETYSFVENIKDYFTIESPGIYVLKSSFFPELKRLPDDSEKHIISNSLTLEVKPALSASSLGSMPVSVVNGEILRKQPIPPDQVIRYTLLSRQKSIWEQFFLYMDIEKMLSKDPARNKRFKAESESGRMKMVEMYKRELMQEQIDKDIAAIPVEFKIEHTAYTDTEAQVKVIEWFQYRNFREKKRFTYYLSSRDGIWILYDYIVENLGTE